MALVRDLHRDPKIVRSQIVVEAVQKAMVSGLVEHGGDFELHVTDPTRHSASVVRAGSASTDD